MNQMDKIMLRKPKKSKKELQGYPIAKLAFCVGLLIVCIELLKLFNFIPILLTNVKVMSLIGLILAGLFGVVSFSGEKNPKRISLLIALAFFILAQIPIFMFLSWVSFFMGFNNNVVY